MVDESAKERQKQNFDSRKGAKELPCISPGDSVWVPDRNAQGQVMERVSPRSYMLCTPEGVYRRNRSGVLPLPGGGDTHKGSPIVLNEPELIVDERLKRKATAAVT